MTSIIELFKGIGVIIDNAFESDSKESHDDIFKIKEILEKSIPNIIVLTAQSGLDV